MTQRECPGCSKPDQKRHLTKSEGRLDQCGKTHLVTTTWTCGSCGFTEWEPAKDAPWRTTEVKDALTGKVLSVPRAIP